MSEVSSKPDLLEQGTRYDHYVELREVFASGIEVINGLSTRDLQSDSDRVLKTKLENAVEVINKRLAFLSDFNEKTVYGSKLYETVREIEQQRRMDAKAKSENPNQVRPPKNPEPQAN